MVAALAMLMAGSMTPAAGATEDVRTSGVRWASTDPSVSGDGRFVAFAVTSTADDSSRRWEVYVRDVLRGTTERVDAPPAGVPVDPRSFSYAPAISADGRFVAFTSQAPNLVPGDTNHTGDVFVRDLRRRTTERVSVSSTGVQADQFSGGTEGVSISADGMVIAFTTRTSFTPRDDNQESDVYVRDRLRGTTTLASVGTDGRAADGPFGALSPSISGDGRFVSFSSRGENFAPEGLREFYDIFVRDLRRRSTRLIPTPRRGFPNTRGVLDGTGRTIAYESFHSSPWGGQVHLADVATGRSQLVSVPSGLPTNDGGDASQPSISADGRLVVFMSLETDFLSEDYTDVVFLRDVRAGRTYPGTVYRPSHSRSTDAVLSASGRFLAYAAHTPVDGTEGVTDVYLRDRHCERTVRISVQPAGPASTVG